MNSKEIAVQALQKIAYGSITTYIGRTGPSSPEQYLRGIAREALRQIKDRKPNHHAQ